MSELEKIYIKKEAFRNMITHVLKHGSKTIDSCSQVIGVCMGKTRNSQVDVVWALPLTHGNYIDIEENHEIIENFSANEEQIWIKQGNTVLGWYCSHPDKDLTITELDIKNHRYFQNKYTPNCFLAIFDHKEMGKNNKLGFKTYYSGTKGLKEVNNEVEIPASFDYFRWIMKFVEDSQLRTPALDFFKEVGEMKSIPTDLQEIPLAPEDLLPDNLNNETTEKVFEKLNPIALGFQEGLKNLFHTLSDPLLYELNQWTTQMEQGTLYGISLLRAAIIQMREAISISMSKISKWFENNLEELIEDFNERVSFNIDERVNTQIELSKLVSSIKEDIFKGMNDVIEENFKTIMKELEATMISMKDASSGLSKISPWRHAWL